MLATIVIVVTIGLLALIFGMPPHDRYGHRLR
jgi:hypothetical protein